MGGPAVLRTQVLRVACVWGSTVLALRTLERGQSFLLGDHRLAVLPIPEGLHPSPTPFKAVEGGWVLDATGALAGLLMLRGRSEDPLEVGVAGPVPVMPGDYGLLQYGELGLFFQYTSAPPEPPRSRGPELMTVLGLAASLLLHGGLVGLARADGRGGSAELETPIELVSRESLATRFGLLRVERPLSDALLQPSRAGAALSPAAPTLAQALDPATGEALGRALKEVRPVPEELLVAAAPPSDPTSVPKVSSPLDGGAGVDGADAASQVSGTDGGAAALSSEQVRRGVVAHTAGIRACYEAEARKKPSLKGDLSVRFRVEPSGAVETAAIATTSLQSPPVEECVVRHVKTWKFPAASLPTEVTYPFKFGG